MSLNWDISKIENHDDLRVERKATPTQEGGKYLDGITEAFIWASMATGLGKDWSLDAEFAPEFYARIRMIEKLDGPLTVGPSAEPITPEDVQRRIGLHVNVSPVTRAKFIKNMVTNDLDSYRKQYGKAVGEAMAAA